MIQGTQNQHTTRFVQHSIVADVQAVARICTALVPSCVCTDAQMQVMALHGCLPCPPEHDNGDKSLPCTLKHCRNLMRPSQPHALPSEPPQLPSTANGVARQLLRYD